MSDIHTMVGAYAVDALSTEERRLFDEHLVDCESCQQEVQEFRDTLARLGPAHEAAPPPAVRRAVLDQISSVRVLPPYDDGQEPPEAEPSSQGATPGRRSVWARRALVLAAAISLLVNLILGATVVHDQQLRQQAEQRVRAEASARAELMSAPDLQVHAARMDDGTPVSYLVSVSQARAMLVTAGLERPQPGRTWQLWTIRDGAATAAGLVTDGGAVQAWIDGFAGAESLAVTDEPEGGSPQPTTTPQAVTKVGLG